MQLNDLFKKSTAILMAAAVLASLFAGCLAAGGSWEEGRTPSAENSASLTGGFASEDRMFGTSFAPVELIAAGGDHSGFIKGGSGGAVHPDEKLTLAEAAQMLFRLIVSPGPERVSFSDVPFDAWYADAIGYLAYICVLDAGKDTVAPERVITRAEFVAMVTYLRAGKEFEAPDIALPDVPEEHPYAREMAYAASMGWIRGDDGGKYKPDNDLTRAETVTIINRVIGAEPDRDYMKNLFFSPFSDLFATHWAYYDIMEAAVEHTHETPDGGPWVSADLESLVKAAGFYFNGLDYYYIGADGMPLRNAYVGGLYFGADGRYTSGDPVIDRYVKDTLRGIITPSMAPMEKLRAAYNYTRDNFTYLRRNYYEMGDISCAAKEATTMFSTRRGNCYCFSAVFYFLARQLGFDAVLISGKVNNRNPVPHAWVEIAENGEMIMYDPELEMAQRKAGHMQYDFFHMAYDETPWRYWR